MRAAHDAVDLDAGRLGGGEGLHGLLIGDAAVDLDAVEARVRRQLELVLHAQVLAADLARNTAQTDSFFHAKISLFKECPARRARRDG